MKKFLYKILHSDHFNFNDDNPWNSKKNGDSFDEFIKKIDKLIKNLKKNDFNNNGYNNNFNSKKIQHIFPIVFLSVYLLSGFFQIQPDEKGVVLRFGKLHRVVDPGLNYSLPHPFEYVIKQNVTALNKIEFGDTPVKKKLFKKQSYNDQVIPTSDSNLVLTGDSNLANVTFSVIWRIRPSQVQNYLFNAKAPDAVVSAVAESVFREIIGQSTFSFIQTEGRAQIRDLAHDALQAIIDEYKLGIEIVRVDLQHVEPPAPVVDSFRDVERAQADQQSEKNKAEAYDRDTRARTRGVIAEILNKAETERQKQIDVAHGEVARFIARLNAYEKDPKIIKKLIYLQQMSNILQNKTKIVTNKNLKYMPHLGLDNLALNKKLTGEMSSNTNEQK